jgi:hypothetical protein
MAIEQIVPWIIYGKGILDELKRGELTPEFLSQNTLLLFRRFKAGYDAKDADKVGESISEQFRGPFYGQSTKFDLVDFFRGSLTPGRLYARPVRRGRIRYG